ncbi:Uncharacterised protein [Serratia plymuthica]|nr:Uncharacterised protein [Serratia plymuthica]
MQWHEFIARASLKRIRVISFSNKAKLKLSITKLIKECKIIMI